MAKKTGMSIRSVELLLNSVIDEIIEQFHKGQTIEIKGFGTFYPYFKQARSYMTPRLKEKREMKGRTTLKFKPSRSILVYEEEAVEETNGTI